MSEARARRSWKWLEVDLDQVDWSRFPACDGVHKVVQNDFYLVQLYAFFARSLSNIAPMWQLVVRRIDGGMSFPWRDLQRIKDELVGAERVAVQVHPPANEVVDQANLAHLWVYPVGVSLPFGLGPGQERGLR